MRGWRHWPGSCPNALQCAGLLHGIREWLLVVEHLQSLGTAMLYVQVGCALGGSLGKAFSGVPVAELAISLFALVAIESGSLLLLRIYLVLLGCSFVIDGFWFFLVANELRSFDRLEKFGKLSAASMYTLLGLEGTSTIVRFFSIFVWLRLLRQGPSSDDAATYEPVGFDARIGTVLHENSTISERFWLERDGDALSSDGETLAGSIYDPVYFSSLFETTKDGGHQIVLDSASSCNPE